MSDRIHIKQLILPTVVGVTEEERTLPQSVRINASLILTKSFCKISDDLDETVDYFKVAEDMRREAASGERKLIETLAEDLAGVILKFEGVRAVELEVEKMILPNCRAVSVEITRARDGG